MKSLKGYTTRKDIKQYGLLAGSRPLLAAHNNNHVYIIIPVNKEVIK